MQNGLQEEKDLQATSAEASFGEKILGRYTKNYELAQKAGVNAQQLFNGFYERDRSKNPDLDVEAWSKQTGMDKFLAGATRFENEYKQRIQDEQTRVQNEATMGDFSRGMVGGMHKTAGLFAGLGMMGANKLLPGKLGEGLASWFGDAYKEQMRQASLYPTKTIMSEKEGEFFDFSQVNDLGSAIDWVQGTMGDLFPSMAVGIASGGIGALGAGAMGAASKGIASNVAKGFVAKQVERLSLKGIVGEEAKRIAMRNLSIRGGAFGQVMGTALMETGGNFAQAVDHFTAKFVEQGMDEQTARLRAMDEASAGLAMATGLASGLVERLGGASRLLDGILGKGASDAVNEVLKVVRSGRANPTVLGRTLNVAKNLLVEAAKQMPEEFGQEAAQEILSLANLDFSDPDFQLMTAENLRDVIGAGIAGAVGGGGSAMATRSVGAANEALGRTPAPDVKGQIESLQLRIRNQEELASKDPEMAARIAPKLEQNRRDLEALAGYAKAEDAGISYADAAARINEESPDPKGKKFGIRQLKNMLRDGRIKKLEEGTVDPASLDAFLEGRKARAEGITDPAEIQKRVADVEAAGMEKKAAAEMADTAMETQAKKATEDERDIDPNADLYNMYDGDEGGGFSEEEAMGLRPPDDIDEIVPGQAVGEDRDAISQSIDEATDTLAEKEDADGFHYLRDEDFEYIKKAAEERGAAPSAVAQELWYSVEQGLTEVDRLQKRIDKGEIVEGTDEYINAVSQIETTRAVAKKLDQFVSDNKIKDAKIRSRIAAYRDAGPGQLDLQEGNSKTSRHSVASDILSNNFEGHSDKQIQNKITNYKKKMADIENQDGELYQMMGKELSHLEQILVGRSTKPTAPKKIQRNAAVQFSGGEESTTVDAETESLMKQAAEEQAAEDAKSGGKKKKHGIEVLDELVGWQLRDKDGAPRWMEPAAHAKDLADPGYVSSLNSEAKDFEPTTDLQAEDLEYVTKKLEFFRNTLTKQLGKKNYDKLVEYGLIRLDRLGWRMSASYFPRARMAAFDPEKMETEQDVLSAFYHEIGVHHGLESLILKHSRPQAWDNFRRSFVKELTGKGPISKDGKKFREAYERTLETYVKHPKTAKHFAALDGMSIEEQMKVDYFFHEFLGQLSDMTDWTQKKQPSWAVWLRDRVLEFLRGLGFQIAPTFEQVGSLIQGSVAHILHTENLGIKSDRLIASHQEAIAQGNVDVASPAYIDPSKPFNVSSYENGLGRALSNFAPTPVVFDGKKYPSSEAAYQSAKKQLPSLSDENVLGLMTKIIGAKLAQHPGLVKLIDDNGGRDFLTSATHNLVKKGAVVKEDRWTGKDGLFMQALRAAYAEIKGEKEPVIQGSVATEKKSVSLEDSHPELPMNYTHDPEKGYQLRKDLLDAGVRNTFDAVWNDFRTATTRRFDDVLKAFEEDLKPKKRLELDAMNESERLAYLSDLVGKTFYMADGTGRIIDAKITEIVHASNITPAEWSKLEGWTKAGYIRQIGEDAGNRYQIRFEVLDKKTKQPPKVEGQVPANKPVVNGPKPTVTDDAEEMQVKRPAKEAKPSTFNEDLAAIRAKSISLVAKSGDIATQKDLDTPTPIGEYRDLAPLDQRFDFDFDTTLPPQFFSLNALTEQQKAEERKLVDAMLKAGLEKHLREMGKPLDPRILNPQEAKPGQRSGAEYQQEAVADTLRALPRVVRMQLLAKTLPEEFRKQLSRDLAYIQKTAKGYQAMIGKGNPETLMTGELAQYMRGVASYVLLVGGQENVVTTAKVTSLKNKMADELAAARKNKEGDAKIGEIKEKYKNQTYEARKVDTKKYTANIEQAVRAASDLAWAVTNREGAFYNRMKQLYGQAFTGYAFALGGEVDNLKTLSKNIKANRKLMDKGQLSFWSAPRADLFGDRAEIMRWDGLAVQGMRIKVLSVAERIPPQNYPTYAAYVDSVGAEVEKDMASQSIFQKMPLESRKLYARMIAGLTAARVYSGRVGAAKREEYDENAARQATMDLSMVSSGLISREDAIALQSILAAEVENRPLSEGELLGLEQAYKLAERLRSDGMLTAAITGPNHGGLKGVGESVKSITGYASLEEFQNDVISLHEEITDMLRMSGAIGGLDFVDLAFPESGDANAVFEGNMVQSSTQPNNVMFKVVSKTLKTLSSKVGSEITVSDGAVFPSVSDGEIEALQGLAAKMKTRASAGPESAMAKLHEEEILLGLIGFGLRESEPGIRTYGPRASTAGLVFQGIPQARLEILQQAGLVDLFKGNYLPMLGAFKKAGVSAYMERSLFQEVELATNGRQATFFSDPGSMDALVQDLMPLEGKHLELRRVAPGSMLYDRTNNRILFVGGMNSTWKYSEKEKTRVRDQLGYSLLTPVVKDGRVVLEYLGEKGAKLHSLAELGEMDLHVVPSVWNLYAGFTNLKKGKENKFEMMDDFEIGNGLQARANQKAISDIIFRNTRFPASRPAYARIITDASGQERLIVHSGEGQQTVVTIGDGDGFSAEQNRLEAIMAGIGAQLRGDKTFQRMLDLIVHADTSTDENIEVAHGYILEQIEEAAAYIDEQDYDLVMNSAEDLLELYINRRRQADETLAEDAPRTAIEIQAEETAYDAPEALDEDNGRGESPTHSKFDRHILMRDEENSEVESLLRPTGSAAEILEAGKRRAKLTNEVSRHKLPLSDFRSAYLGVFSALPRAAKQKIQLILTEKDWDASKNKGLVLVEDDGKKVLMSLSEAILAGHIEPSVNGLIDAGYHDVALHLLSAMSMDQNLAFKTGGKLSRMAARVAYATRAEALLEESVIPFIVDKAMGAGAYKKLGDNQKQIVLSMLNVSGLLKSYLDTFKDSVWGKAKFINPWVDAKAGAKMFRVARKAGFGMLVGTRFRAVDTVLAGKADSTFAEGLDVGAIAYEIARADLPLDMTQATIGADVEDRKALWYPETYKPDFKESSGFPDQETLYPNEFKERLDAHLVQAIIDEFSASGSLSDIAEKLADKPTLAYAQELLAERFDDSEEALMTIARGRLRVDDASFGARTTEDIVGFVGVDGVGYSVITEEQAAANREEYPVLREKMISGADYALMLVINEIAPGNYEIGKFTSSKNGRSATVKIAGQQVAVEFGERSVLTDFGWSLMQALRRHHDEMYKNPAMGSTLRRKIEAAVVKHIDIVKIYGRGVENLLLSKHRIRSSKNPHAIDEKKLPPLTEIFEKAKEILAELTVFGGKIPEVILHGPTENGWGFVNNPETKGLVDASTEALLARGEHSQIKTHLENTMGLVDRFGRIHVFLGQHATKDGKLDWNEFGRTVYHEGIGHLGLRKVLGEQYEDFMLGVFNSHLKNERNQKATRQQRIDAAEEWMAGKAEQVRMDAAAGRPTNRNIGTLLDKLAAMVVRAFRRIMDKLGFKGEQAATGFEVREALARAFEGSRVAGRTGFSALFSPSMLPGENLIRYESFDEYRENTADTLLRKFTDYLRRWEMLDRSVRNYDGKIADDENFMYGLRTQKSRIGSLINYAQKHTKEFEQIFKGQSFDVEDVSHVMHALHALERNSAGIPAYLDMLESRMRQKHVDKVAAGVYKTEAELSAGIADLNNRIRSMRKRRASLIEKGNSPAISGMSTNGAKNILAQAVGFGFLKDNGDGTYSGKMMDAVNKLVEANRYAMDIARAGGMISQSEFDYLYGTPDKPGAYKFFVPIPGRPESMLGGLEYFDAQAGNRFRYAQGTATLLGMPYDEQRTIVGAVFAGLRSRIAEASMNTTYQTIYQFAKNHENPEVFQIFLPHSEFEALMDESKQNEEQRLNDRGIFRMPPVMGMTRKAVKEFEAENGYIPVYVEGRMRYMKIMDEGLRRGLEHLNNPTQTGRVMRALSAVNRWLIKVNTSLNPEFFVPNMLRDIGSAFNTLSIRENVAGLDGRDFAKKAVKLAIPAMAVIKAKNFGDKKDGLTPTQKKLWDMMDDFEDYGGKIQWAFLESAEETMSSISEAVRIIQGKGTKKENFAVFAGKIEDLFKKSSDIFENSTRLAVFTAAVEAGASKQEAALMAREITVDFDRKGEMGQAINTLYMFANAGIQGTLTILRTATRNPGRAAKHLGAIVGFSLSLAILNAFAGGSGDDDEPVYFGIPEETRNGNMIFMLPGLEQGVKIPIPWGYAFFWSIGQQLGNMLMGRSSAQAVGAALIGSGLNNFNPLESAASLENSHGWVRMLAPTIIDPLVDIGFEKTPFGTPLMPDRVYEDQPDSARHWRSVSGPSKDVAAWINEFGGGSAGVPGAISVSPETLDLLFEQATGGLGRVITRSIGAALSPASGKEMTMNDVPLVRRFFAGQGSWEDRSRFRSNYDEIHGVNRTFKNLRDNVALARTPELRAAAKADLDAFRSENAHILAMRPQVNRTYSRVKTIDEQKKALYKSGLPESEVNPKLRLLDERQREIFTTFNRMYYEKIDR